ncbi:hypothetical protein GW17_00036450 [Ensete ventricosum]|nr:hypothetical protein GW17_00036450 [Ensete ventricosum]
MCFRNERSEGRPAAVKAPCGGQPPAKGGWAAHGQGRLRLWLGRKGQSPGQGCRQRKAAPPEGSSARPQARATAAATQ